MTLQRHVVDFKSNVQDWGKSVDDCSSRGFGALAGSPVVFLGSTVQLF
ncbi:hypothetical protein [Corynebacterium stationis]|nr:hypothetical protein [Corynebacterium stationis]HJG64903.1 hypothetical protein [Corynebacterium stationis]